MFKESRIKIKSNVLSHEECAEIIANASSSFEYDILKKDIALQSKYFDKETLDKNTIESSLEASIKSRRVLQSPIDEPIFPEWDGNPVYRCKVMKYETGDFIREHRDATWMCLSNYWAPNTNMVSDSLISIALNDDYEGGDFTVEGEIIPQTIGSAIQIPMNALDKTKSVRHGVTKVTSGTRYALVFWNFA